MKKEWLIAGVIAGCFAGVGAGACGSSSGTGGSGVGASGAGATSTTGTPSSTTTGSLSSTSGSPASTTSGGGSVVSTSGGGSVVTTSGGGSVVTTSGGGSVSSTTAASSSGCHAPTTLHPPSGPGNSLYCPFSGVDGGPPEYCNPTPGDPATAQHCCVTPEGSPAPSSCVTGLTTSCPTSTLGTVINWECADPVTDCPTGMDCCATPSTAMFASGGPGCENFTTGKMTGTTCVAAGTCTSIILCTNNTECPAAHPTCTAFEKGGNDVGGCQ